jgi:Tfp pilus assembly protein PilN
MTMIESLMLRLAPYKLMLQIAAAVMVAVAAFGAGWLVNGWRLRSELSELRADRATEKADQATAALTTLKDDADKIHAAATEYAGIQNTLAPKIVALTKELRNAPRLPVDCRPDDVRVRNLDAAIDAANQAIPR